MKRHVEVFAPMPAKPQQSRRRKPAGASIGGRGADSL